MRKGCRGTNGTTLCWAEEGVLPFFKATSAYELAEEARVLSVMISRLVTERWFLPSKCVGESYAGLGVKTPLDSPVHSRTPLRVGAVPPLLSG